MFNVLLNLIVILIISESPEEILSQLSCNAYNDTKDWYMKFYKKEEFPKRLHYASHRRIEEVVVHVAEEWLVERSLFSE